MLDWKSLVLLSDEQLSEFDIAEVQLACAAGLPDADIDVATCLNCLDQWADYSRRFTETAFADFLKEPENYNHSLGYFQILCMITALQRDLGVRYNEAKIPEDVPLDTADTFIHGVQYSYFLRLPVTSTKRKRVIEILSLACASCWYREMILKICHAPAS